MKRHPLRNTRATLLEDGRALVVESPEGERFPVEMGVLSLTSRCNLACVMCLEPRGPGGVDLPFAEAMGFVELFAGRVPTIWTCAGEALLYPRFLELARAIARRGTRLGVGTNGVPLGDADLVARCADAGVRCLHISCHTARPDRFAAITATSGPRQFEAFVRGLDVVDAWNRDHEPARRLEVLLQLVLFKPFADELEEYLDFVAGHLAHSAPVIRVEPMQPMNAGAQHPELLYDVAELGGIVRALIQGHGRRFTFELKSLPLCLLDGAEGLSEDLRARARGSVVVGNLGRQSGALQLQCPIGDPARSACATRCATCSLVNLCPGVMDNPVPAGSPWPRPRAAPAEALLARLGLRVDLARRRFALDYPLRSTAPDPDAGEPAAPVPGEEPAAPGGLAALGAGRLGVDPESPARFTPAQRGRIEEMVDALRRAAVVAEAVVDDRFAALRLHDARRAPAATVVVLEPAGPETPSYFAAAGVAVRYHGELTPELRSHLERIRRLLDGASRAR